MAGERQQLTASHDGETLRGRRCDVKRNLPSVAFGQTQIPMIALYTFFRGSQEIFLFCSHFPDGKGDGVRVPMRR